MIGELQNQFFRKADRSEDDLVGTVELEPLAGIIGRRDLPPEAIFAGRHAPDGIRFRARAGLEPEGILQPTDAVVLGRRAPSFRRAIKPGGSSSYLAMEPMGPARDYREAIAVIS
ncbi:hypothetical protein, partial [Bosea sp. Root483D1]|uniref:hypothetical protein n=1 Tax=Bosea sp. Root483D1 TaxID=1736544 RepID=UPI001AECC0A6